MVFVSAIVDKSVDEKLDTDFIREILKDLQGDIAIVFACTKGDWRENDTWKSKGTKYYQIVLPYEKVANMDADAVRQWMLRLAEERLGLVEQQQ